MCTQGLKSQAASLLSGHGADYGILVFSWAQGFSSTAAGQSSSQGVTVLSGLPLQTQECSDSCVVQEAFLAAGLLISNLGPILTPLPSKLSRPVTGHWTWPSRVGTLICSQQVVLYHLHLMSDPHMCPVVLGWTPGSPFPVVLWDQPRSLTLCQISSSSGLLLFLRQILAKSLSCLWVSSTLIDKEENTKAPTARVYSYRRGEDLFDNVLRAVSTFQENSDSLNTLPPSNSINLFTVS